ncbi:MAG TPA: chloride channel protein [Candidatus Limnocylindria bacterium]|nr:chloride channel protein [Candidatus Limnocylindria bacterium]
MSVARKAHRSEGGAASLGDFIASPRIIVLAALAVPIGLIGALLAWLLLNLIGLFTNLFFFGRIRFDLISPAAAPTTPWIVIVPVVGGLVVGLMARYGSDRIRGHGIPEAIEAILINRSRVEPKVAVLKPLSSAIAIGSGGPFGAEGPIIMTGGAVGSMLSQFLHLTSAERKTLLVAGAAAGMAATFDSPVAAVLLAVELLLFEWRPRSLVPVAVAAICATVLRHAILGVGPLFPVPPHAESLNVVAMLACVLVGLLAGGLSTLLTQGVYFAEDTFEKLPIHWMWWPAIGGLFVGIGGLIFPHALGVGYDTLRALLNGDVAGRVILGVLVVKSLIWTIALGSGTSGGVLAPLLMMGAALGGVEAMVLPDMGVGFWPLVSMGAILGGTMRVPFTAIVFALELTHDLNALLPLLIAVTAAYTFTVLLMKRSILTEKLSRRGHHLSREYAVDPMEGLFVSQVMRSNLTVLLASTPLSDLAASLKRGGARGVQALYPVTDDDGRMLGVVTRHDMNGLLAEGAASETTLRDVLRPNPVVAYPDEPLRSVVYRMAETGLTRMPVVERDDPTRLVSVISLRDLLGARVQALEEERERERTLRIRTFIPRQFHLRRVRHASAGSVSHED